MSEEVRSTFGTAASPLAQKLAAAAGGIKNVGEAAHEAAIAMTPPPRYEAREQGRDQWSVWDNVKLAWAVVRDGNFIPHHSKDRGRVDAAVARLNGGA